MTSPAKFEDGCVLCDGERIERNHVGGRKHVAWFTMPFCRKHHDQFHALLRIAGVSLEYTSDLRVRLVRAIMACLVALWMLAEALLNSLSQTKK